VKIKENNAHCQSDVTTHNKLFEIINSISNIYSSYELHINYSDSAKRRSQDICPPISQVVLKNFIKMSLIIKECLEEILIKLAIVLKILKSS
jgi:hypothetical protein